MAASSNPIPYWGVYGAGTGFDYDPTTTAPGRQFLDALRKIDPNATFVQVQGGGGEGGPGGTSWQLQTNVKFPGGDLNPGDYGPMYYEPSYGQFDPHQYNQSFRTDALVDPNATHQSPTFGTYTDQSNIRQTSSPLDYLGPAAVLGFGALMGGIPALYQGVFGQGSFGGGFDPALSVGNPMAPFDPQYTPMSPFNPSPADIGLGGSADVPLGSAESSLYGTVGATDPAQALGGAFDPNLDVTGGFKLPMTPGYEQMTPFNPASPEYGSFAINPDGSPVPQLNTGGSGLSNALGKIPQVANALGKIPGLGGGSGSGGGNVGLLGGGGTYQMQPYKSLTALLRNYGLLGMPNG